MPMMPRLALPLVPIFLLAACATTGQRAPLPDGSNVALGERAYVDGPLVKPVQLLEDSRCPVDAHCVWAGRVRVKMLWLRPTGEERPFEVTLGESTQLADGAITLTAVRPGKRAGRAIAPKDYRFSLHFDGGL